MKKGIIIGTWATIVLSLCLSLCFGAAAPKYWNDVLQVKPSTEWQKLYGWGDVAFLAHGQWVNRQLLDGQGAVIAAMKKEMDEIKARLTALEPAPAAKPDDPNNIEVKE